MALSVVSALLLGLLTLCSGDSTPIEEDPILSPRFSLFDQRADQDNRFYACCQDNAVFSSDGPAKTTCRYWGNINPRTLFFLPKQKQSDWLKCFGGNRDYTDCCRKRRFR